MCLSTRKQTNKRENHKETLRWIPLNRVIIKTQTNKGEITQGNIMIDWIK